MTHLLLVLATALTTSAFCLTLPGQRWRHQPLSAHWRSGALLCLALLLIVWCWRIETLAAVLSWLTTVMLSLSLFPALALVRLTPEAPGSANRTTARQVDKGKAQ